MSKNQTNIIELLDNIEVSENKSGEKNDFVKVLNKLVEITCPEDRVKQTVENVIGGIDTNTSLKPPAVDLKTPISIKSNKSTEHVICRDLIELLWLVNWFNGERNLSEVDEELSRRGYHYDKTSISHSLKDLVRENILTRNGSMRNYRYVQKRPPVA